MRTGLGLRDNHVAPLVPLGEEGRTLAAVKDGCGTILLNCSTTV
jgi:hypothetical protein